jgi:RNA polymerase sigma-70 factor (ECF subfamily)
MFLPQERSPTDSFATTSWSLLFATTRGARLSKADEEFAGLCEIYWRPIYRFIAAQGYGAADAQDIMLRFLGYLIDHRRANSPGARVHLRPYIYERLKYFLAAEAARQHAPDRNSMRT